MVSQAHLIVSTEPLIAGGIERMRGLLDTAERLANFLLNCLPKKDDDSKGDAYCYVAIERNHKLVVNFTLGRRNQQTTDTFIEGVRHAMKSGERFQITTDGFGPYVSAITTTLSDRCDYAMHIKVYGQPEDGERRCSPAEVVSSEKDPVMGNPDNPAFARPMWSARTSRCGCKSAASPA